MIQRLKQFGINEKVADKIENEGDSDLASTAASSNLNSQSNASNRQTKQRKT